MPGLPAFENGMQLKSDEFMRRYGAYGEDVKAELIDGTVFIMSLPSRADQHGDPDSLLQTWLGFFGAMTRGVQSSTNSTTLMGPDDVLQPDCSLRLLPAFGGNAKTDENGYLVGAPELVVEIAASSASIDVRRKREAYRRAGVREYLVWRTEDGAVDWWALEQGEYCSLLPDADGIVKSRMFPGLWLGPAALLAQDGGAVLEVLHRGLESEEYGAFAARLRAMEASA